MHLTSASTIAAALLGPSLLRASARVAGVISQFGIFMHLYIWIIIVAVIALNVVVSIFIATRDDLENAQKWIQAGVVWVVPFLGAIGIYLVLRSFVQPFEKAKPEFGGGAIDSGHVSSGGGGNS
jgi:hypothetical protein